MTNETENGEEVKRTASTLKREDQAYSKGKEGE
jgi:hypothetical protein